MIFQLTPTIVQYWLGTPGKYLPGRADLDLYPEGDLGGREFQLPSEVKPQQFFDMTMPMVNKLQNDAQKRLGIDPQLHPFGILSQGIQTVWIFTSMEVSKLQKQVFELESRIKILEERLDVSKTQT
jgi:hypothetical protein